LEAKFILMDSEHNIMDHDETQERDDDLPPSSDELPPSDDATLASDIEVLVENELGESIGISNDILPSNTADNDDEHPSEDDASDDLAATYPDKTPIVDEVETDEMTDLYNRSRRFTVTTKSVSK
jgi:hypothetical protein